MAKTLPNLNLFSGKSVLVLGAGIGGLRVAQKLAKKLPKGWTICLVDKSPVHVFTPDLYQVATVFVPERGAECYTTIQETVATPIARLVDPWKVSFVQAEVTGIDPKRKQVFLAEGAPLTYDVLVVALGSTTHDYGISGIEKYAFPLKTVQDALAVNAHIEHLFQDSSREEIHITLGGGGATGVEVMGELAGMTKLLCQKYAFPEEKVHLRLVQGGDTLGGFGPEATAWIRQKLEDSGVELWMNEYIEKLNEHEIFVRSKEGEKKILPNDMLIWTAGVKVNPVVAKSLGREATRGAIEVEESLYAKHFESIFACGDNASFWDEKNQRTLPMMAQVAMKQADVLVHNVLAFIRKKPKSTWKRYKVSIDLYVVPVGSKLTVFQVGTKVFRGFWTSLLKKLVSLKYATMIMPLRKALHKWRFGDEIFVRNDELD